MIAFILLVIIAIIILWFLLCFLFKPLGGFLCTIFNEVKNAMEIDNNQNESEEK